MKIVDFLSKSRIVASLQATTKEQVLAELVEGLSREYPSMDKDRLIRTLIERENLGSLKSIATKVIDTSDYNVHQLTDYICQYFSQATSLKKMTINLLSFGFKFGLPYDADLIMDVRFLPNPYFVENLRSLNGEDKRVSDYVLMRDETKTFIKKFSNLVHFLIPLYEREGKAYLTIAIGCTGGKHRSTAVVNKLADTLLKWNHGVNVRHRDKDAQ